MRILALQRNPLHLNTILRICKWEKSSFCTFKMFILIKYVIIASLVHIVKVFFFCPNVISLLMSA